MVIIKLFRFVMDAIDQRCSRISLEVRTRIGRVRQVIQHVIVGRGQIVWFKNNIMVKRIFRIIFHRFITDYDFKEMTLKIVKIKLLFKKRISMQSREEQHWCGIVTILFRNNDLCTAFPHTVQTSFSIFSYRLIYCIVLCNVRKTIIFAILQSAVHSTTVVLTVF